MQATNKNLDSLFPIYLHNEAYNLANNISENFPEKKQQIYWNVLGIYTVKTYCDFLEIETDFSVENTVDVITQTFLNTASLRLTNLGIVECIPFLSGADTIKIPRETWENRIGYLAVEINESKNQAIISKFLPACHPDDMSEEIPIKDLFSLETFLEQIERIEIGQDFLSSQNLLTQRMAEKLGDLSQTDILINLDRIARTYDEDQWQEIGGEFLINCYVTETVIPEETDITSWQQREISECQKEKLSELAEQILFELNQMWIQQEIKEIKTIKLSKWLEDIQNIFDAGWQTLEVFRSMYQTELNFATATALRTRKSIVEKTLDKRTVIKDIEQEVHYPVALMVTLEQMIDEKYDILYQVTPIDSKERESQDPSYLPSNLTLAIFDEHGNSFMETKAREKDNLIQLQFRGMLENKFSLVVKLNDSEFKKDFEF